MRRRTRRLLVLLGLTYDTVDEARLFKIQMSFTHHQSDMPPTHPHTAPTTRTTQPTTPTMSKLQDRIKPDSIIKNHYGGYQRHSPRFIVGYWSIRGLGAPIRMLLSAAQVDHWVVMYDCKEEQTTQDDATGSDGWDKSSWLNDKEWLKKEHYPLINLPFLLDCAEERVLSQTNAILTYLGRELKMFGTTKWQACQCGELLCEIMDLRDLMVYYAYDDESSDKATAKADAKQLLEDANRHFERLEQHLRIQNPDACERIITRDVLDDTIGFSMNSVCHLVGGNFSAPDFHLWEMLDQYQGLCSYWELPNCLGDAITCSDQVDKLKMGQTNTTEKSTVFPYLKEFHTAFINLPGNHNYATMYNLSGVIDKDAIKLPYNNPYARFGSGPSNENYVRGQSAAWRNLGEKKKTYTRIATGIEHWDDEAVSGS